MLSDPGTSLSGCRVALLSCGQFDPPSYAHLRMFERARDFLVRTMGCKVVEGIMSVAGDSTKTRTSAKHRLRMVETAVRKNFWIRAGDFECNQKSPIRQIAVLKHYQKKLQQKHDEPIRVLYVCGSEVLDELVSVQPNRTPLWNHAEIKELLQRHGLIVLKRSRTHPSHTIYLTDILRQYQKNIYVIEDETFPNDLRCSRIRTALRRGESVKYCLDDDVIEYINENNLYRESPDDDNDQSASGISTLSEPNLTCSASSSRIRRNTDDEKVPPEPPQRGSSEKASERYRTSTTLPSAEWRTPPTSQPSSSESCTSSREASEPRHLPHRPCRSAREPTSYTVKWSDALEPQQSSSDEQQQQPQEHSPKAPEYASMVRKHQTDENSNQVTVTAPDKEAVSANISLTPKKLPETSKHSDMDGIPPELPKTAFMKPILSQPKPASDSPLFNGNATDCEAIPNCVLSSVTSDARGALRSLTDSPAYDNVTLDDLLAASTSWAEYLHKESERIEGLSNDDCKESLVPNDPPPSRVPPTHKTPPLKEKFKKKSWFFNRSKSLKDLKPVEEEALIRICATDRREQTETSPEILRRRINQTAGKDRWSDLPPPPRQPPYCLRHPDRQLERCARKESKNIRFGMTKSAESVHQVLDARSQESGRVVADSARAPPAPTMTQSNYEGATQSEDGVTLRFRRYKLASTPETTV